MMQSLAEEDPTTLDFSSEDEDVTDDGQEDTTQTEVTSRSSSPLLIYDPLPVPTLVESHSSVAGQRNPSMQPSGDPRHQSTHDAHLVPLGPQYRSEDLDEISPLKRARDDEYLEDIPRPPPNLRTNGRDASSNCLRNPGNSMQSLTADLLRLEDTRRNERIKLYRPVKNNAFKAHGKKSLAKLPSSELVAIRKSDLFSLAAAVQIGARDSLKLQDYSTDQDAESFMNDTIVAALDTEHKHRQEFNRKLDKKSDIERHPIRKADCELSIGRVVLTEYQGIRRRHH